jgi:nicotinate phosphoribosyltransferase
VILASNDLDERIIESLKHQGAKIAVWGVGTRLVTAYDQPALGGVYKLGAIQDKTGAWVPKMKRSEQAAKRTIPGVLQVRRYESADGLIADMIYDESLGIDIRRTIVDNKDAARRRHLAPDVAGRDLLVPVMRGGKRTGDADDLAAIRQRAIAQLAQLHPTIHRFLNPHEYPVGIDVALHELREQMLLQPLGETARSNNQQPQGQEDSR